MVRFEYIDDMYFRQQGYIFINVNSCYPVTSYKKALCMAMTWHEYITPLTSSFGWASLVDYTHTEQVMRSLNDFYAC